MNPATMLTMSQAPAVATTSTATVGRDAYRSALDSSKLTGDLDGPREEALVAIAPTSFRELVFFALYPVAPPVNEGGPSTSFASRA